VLLVAVVGLVLVQEPVVVVEALGRVVVEEPVLDLAEQLLEQLQHLLSGSLPIPFLCEWG